MKIPAIDSIIHKKKKQDFTKKSRCAFSLIGTFYIVCHCNEIYAVNWTVRPYVQAQEVFSDNITLAQQESKKSAFVTELSPGISVLGQCGRTNLNLIYQLQNLYNARGSNDVSTNNQLRFSTRNILVPNKFFLNSTSSISQQNTSNNQIANDNISGSGDRTDVKTFSISPYWTPQFGNYARGNFNLNFSSLSTGLNNSTSNTFSDTQNYQESAQLSSGSEFKIITWSLFFNNSESQRSRSSNVTFQSLNGTIRANVSNHFNFFIQSGFSENQFQSTADSSRNGTFYTYGVQWKPSRYYSIQGGWGNNKYVTLSLNPMQRLSWVITYRDNSIGLNSGTNWLTRLYYQTGRSIWTLTHDVDTTTTQQILFQQVNIDNPDTPFVDNTPALIPTFNDEVIVRKTWNFSVNFRTGKSSLGASAFNEDRNFQTTGNNEKISGINGYWNWRFASRTSAFLSPGWSQIDRGSSDKDNRYNFSVGINRSITDRIYGRIQFSHLNQDSADPTRTYQENRATANLSMRF